MLDKRRRFYPRLTALVKAVDTAVIVLLRAIKALTYAALILIVGLSVGCGNDMSVI